MLRQLRLNVIGVAFYCHNFFINSFPRLSLALALLSEAVVDLYKMFAEYILFKQNFSCNCSRKLNLFLRKSIKLLPPELLLLAQICTKSFGGWGFAPDPTGGAYSAPPDPLAGFKGAYF